MMDLTEEFASIRKIRQIIIAVETFFICPTSILIRECARTTKPPGTYSQLSVDVNSYISLFAYDK
jgi:hypothetical protein